jgi:hypothetical protein
MLKRIDQSKLTDHDPNTAVALVDAQSSARQKRRKVIRKFLFLLNGQQWAIVKIYIVFDMGQCLKK